MEKIFDSHSHYNNQAFDEDYDALMQHLKDNGVGYVMNCGSSVDASRKAMEQSETSDFMCFSAGIHPLDIEDDTCDTDFEEIEKMAAHPKCKAIGEIGLDYHYDDAAEPQKQKEAFIRQLDMAVKLDMPVIIHIREAMQDSLEILKQYKGKVRGVIHCFSGSAESCKELVKMGYYIGFTGVVTFKNARKALEAMKVVPFDRLLIETDCPYMAPEPYRGKRCDSSMLDKVAQKIADELGKTKEEVLAQTYANAARLFEIEQ
ncbi:MAG: TatD family hydrolase [Oscillospiraceae bacterium]|nr:TatD family hydrolase [Oscillospiraceae bacterium]